MKKLFVRLGMLLLVLSVILSGCTASTPTSAPTINPTAVPTNTLEPPTDVPTAMPPTPTFTATSVPPTNTPTVTPTPPPTATATRTLVPKPTVTTGPKPTVAPKTPPLVSTLFQVRNYIQDIGGAMDRLYHGSGAEACSPLLVDYNGTVNAPAYDMTGQPPATQSAYGKYRAAITIIAGKVQPIANVCNGGGGSIGNQDFNNARTSINDAGDLIGQALQLMGQ